MEDDWEVCCDPLNEGYDTRTARIHTAVFFGQSVYIQLLDYAYTAVPLLHKDTDTSEKACMANKTLA